MFACSHEQIRPHPEYVQAAAKTMSTATAAVLPSAANAEGTARMLHSDHRSADGTARGTDKGQHKSAVVYTSTLRSPSTSGQHTTASSYPSTMFPATIAGVLLNIGV